MKLVIGSRGSDLALTQTRTIAALLRGLPSVREVEIVVIKTSGDRIQDTPLADVTGTPDERKGFFTKELEDALLAGTIDLAVHSYKDLPTAEVPGLVIGAVPQRVGARDVLVLRPGARAREIAPFVAPGEAIGTASVRRAGLVELLWPDVRTVPLRGNLPTRLRRLKEGKVPDLLQPGGPPVSVQAILLAEAGLERLRAGGVFTSGDHAGLLDDLEIVPLDGADFPGAPAQGALAIQCRAGDDRTAGVLAQLHDPAAASGVQVERSVLAALEGGCHLPLGVACRVDPDLGEQAVRVDVFLGARAQDNRWQWSRRFTRWGVAHGASVVPELAARIVTEIRTELPVVFTGRADRAVELGARFPIVQLPLLATETIPVSSEQRAHLIEWCSQATEPDSCVALFSVPGAAALADLLDSNEVRLPPGVGLAVTGERTAEKAGLLFPNNPVVARSPDGTGAALAAVLLEHKVRDVLCVAAERGRPEFRERMSEAGASVLALDLYRSIPRIPDAAELSRLPEECYLVFGSPSSVDAFFEAHRRAGLGRPGWRACAIGPTTAARLVEAGVGPYIIAAEADYETLLAELLEGRI